MFICSAAFRVLHKSLKYSARKSIHHASFKMPKHYEKQLYGTTPIPVEELRRFMMECLERVGMLRGKARCVADVLVAADYRGKLNCGLNRLELFLYDIYKRYVDIEAEPCIIKQSDCVAHVDGRNAVGVFVANYCMELAVKKACDAGIGMVVAKQSNYYGMGAWYVFRAVRRGFVGIVMSNGWPLLVPPNGQNANIGSNYLSMGAKANEGHFLLDIATTVKNIGDIELAYLKNEYIPTGWGMDEFGYVTASPHVVLHSQKLCPAGGHKGYCLSVLIDLLCGVLSGACYATQVQKYLETRENGMLNLGQLFIALDPEFFVPDFKDRLEDFLRHLTKSRPADSQVPGIILPGEPEKKHMAYVEDMRAIPLPDRLLMKYKRIANMLHVKPLQAGFGRNL